MSKAALLELADRVEKASRPDRELDAEIVVALDLRPDWLRGSDGLLWINAQQNKAEVLFAHGGRKHPGNVPAWYEGDFYEGQQLPHYTSSLDAAMTLVPGGYPIETMSWWPSVPAGYEDQRCCHLTLLELDHGGFAGLKRFKARAVTPALALIAASIRARAQQESKDA